MKLIPQNEYILCKQINATKHEDKSKIFFYEKEELPIYEIIDISKTLDNFRFTVGDNVICNSTGTKVNLDNSNVYLFNTENIVGKIN